MKNENKIKMKAKRVRKKRKQLQQTSELSERGKQKRELDHLKRRILVRMLGRQTRLHNIKEKPRRKKQTGGFSSSGNFNNLINNIQNTVTHTFSSISHMFDAVMFAVNIPSTLQYSTGKEAEPTLDSV